MRIKIVNPGNGKRGFVSINNVVLSWLFDTVFSNISEKEQQVDDFLPAWIKTEKDAVGYISNNNLMSDYSHMLRYD